MHASNQMCLDKLVLLSINTHHFLLGVQLLLDLLNMYAESRLIKLYDL